jgi:hypothetical protein
MSTHVNASTLTVGVSSDATVHQQSDINSSSYQGSTNTVADGVGTAPADPTVAATHSDISRNDTNSLSCESDANTEPIGTTFDEPTVASAHLNVNSRNSNSSKCHF